MANNLSNKSASELSAIFKDKKKELKARSSELKMHERTAKTLRAKRDKIERLVKLISFLSEYNKNNVEPTRIRHGYIEELKRYKNNTNHQFVKQTPSYMVYADMKRAVPVKHNIKTRSMAMVGRATKAVTNRRQAVGNGTTAYRNTRDAQQRNNRNKLNELTQRVQNSDFERKRVKNLEPFF